MRLNFDEGLPRYAAVGDTTTRTFFAWTPIFAGNEMRWLERVTVEYVARYVTYYMFRWEKKRFID
jgi:hypothetical protein